MVLFQIKEYLKFLIKSTNQHGVHSPFIYSLVTQCFYDRKKKVSYPQIKSILEATDNKDISYKNLKLIDRLLLYLNYQKVLVIENPPELVQKVISINTQVSTSNTIISDYIYDLIYLDFTKYTDSLDILFSKTHNDSLLVCNKIYQTKENLISWNQIQKHPKVTVTIDTFDLGFVFFRKEQAKEHFLIRL